MKSLEDVAHGHQSGGAPELVGDERHVLPLGAEALEDAVERQADGELRRPMAKLLVVDDEKGIRQALVQLFEYEGHDVRAAEDAVAVVANQTADEVLV